MERLGGRAVLPEELGVAALRLVVEPAGAGAVLVELAFISNVEDEKKLKYCVDDFARAIARGVTDYELME